LIAAGAGSAIGVGAASATGAVIAAGIGAASGIGTAAATGAEGGVIAAGVGTAAGIGTASAVGEDASAVVPPVFGGGGAFKPPRPRPFLVEGVGHGILPELEGYAVGTAGAVVGRARGIVVLAGHGSGDIGVKGMACSIARLPLIASASMDAGSAGQAEVSFSICKGAAMGDHDPDEHVVIALMMAA
jgi:hypothetical protein